MKKQSQESQSESQVKIGSKSGGFSELFQLHRKVSMGRSHEKIGEPLFYKPNSKGHITLSDEQKTVLGVASRGQSVLVTDSTGTGKSYFLDFVEKILKELHGPGSVFVIASTRIVACHLNGMTLHSFSRAAPYYTTKEKLLIMIERKEKSVIWLKAKALIIDEIR